MAAGRYGLAVFSTHRLRFAADAVAALAVFAVYCSFAAMDGTDGSVYFTGPAWLGWLTAAAVAGPIAVRRRWPVLCAAVTAAGCAAAALLDMVREPFVPAAVVLYTVGAQIPWRRSAVVFAGVAAALAGGVVAGTGVVTPSETPANAVALAAAVWCFAGIGWGAGVAMRRKRSAERRARARERVHMVAEERMRIARELHDIVSHSLGLIAVQAGVANHVADEQPERAREALRSIESTSRDALAEMRSVLTVLRAGPSLETGREPVPGVEDLEALVERARAAGVRVAAEVDVPVRLPGGVALAVYRVVQEALTNVVKHAGAGSCTVTVRADRREVAAAVVDDGTGAPSGEGGHGLIGMRERVLMYGGSFTAGPVPGGGFAVRAVLPYADGAAGAAARDAAAAGAAPGGEVR